MQKGVHSTQAHSADQIRLLTSAIDKAAKRGIIHRNAARRRKERLNKALAGTKRVGWARCADRTPAAKDAACQAKG